MSAMSPEMIERTNALRRESFDEAVGEGNRWLVECTDDFVFGLGYYEDDDGVFFTACKTDADVDTRIDEYEGTLNTCRDVIDLQTPINEEPQEGEKIMRWITVADWKERKR